MQTKYFKMFIRKIQPMSWNGFNRLNSRCRRNFTDEVYKPLGKVVIDTDRIYDEQTLAYFLLLNFGAGKYDALYWDRVTHRFRKRLFLVEIEGTPDTRWTYSFSDSWGISRMKSWWIG